MTPSATGRTRDDWTSLAVSRIRSRSRILKLWEDANRWSHTGHADGDELALHTQTEQQAPLGGAVARGSPGLGTLLASAPHTANTKEEMESDATSSTKEFVNSLARASGGSRWRASRIHATWLCAQERTCRRVACVPREGRGEDGRGWRARRQERRGAHQSAWSSTGSRAARRGRSACLRPPLGPSARGGSLGASSTRYAGC